MKKVIALLLVAVTLVSLCACGKSAKKETISADEAIENSVVREARGYVVINYENVKNVFTTVTSTRSNDDRTYDVKGYVEVLDDYNDRYKGKFDALVAVNLHDDGTVSGAFCKSFDLETPTKSN